MSNSKPSLERACKIAGGQEKLGDLIGESQQFISHLMRRAKSIKAGVALRIAKETGVPFEEIIRDFDPESEAA